jgi:hypothetical protein
MYATDPESFMPPDLLVAGRLLLLCHLSPPFSYYTKAILPSEFFHSMLNRLMSATERQVEEITR